MKFLVTGAAGLVGNQLVKDLSNSHDVFSCYNQSQPESGTPLKMDLQNHEMISNVLLETESDVVIHLGAMTGVDSCEKEESMAFDINTNATQVVAQQCSKLDKFLIYVSTDYVFDGNSSMYRESDVPNPLSIYGKSKEYIIETMKQLRNGESSSTVMGRIAKGYSDREIILIANYFSSLTEDIKQM